MSDIFITGHRNPDLDSVCSAYAFAVLKNKIDSENNYVAVRCGHLSQTARKVLESLNIQIPPYMRDIYPKVNDVMLTKDSHIELATPLSELALTYDDSNPSVTPVYDGDRFVGLLSVDDISHWAMKTLSEHGVIDAVPLVRDIMRDQEAPCMDTDMFEDAKSQLSSSQKRGLAVMSEQGYVGYVTRRCFLKTPKHKVILVDHNEPKQSIRGIETAEIVEILDHHRLDAVKTDLPIYIDAEPLGSTCTIVYRQFMQHGLTPDACTARVLLTGIIADTLILRSPTTTDMDVEAAHRCAALCGEEMQEFGISMFSGVEGLKARDPFDAISSDFKSYTEHGIRFGIAQCEVTTLHDMEDYRESYLKALDEYRTHGTLDLAVLMVTDVLTEHSVLLCTRHRCLKHLQYTLISELTYDMPGVMSRKKQLLPEIISALGM